jgi:phosphoribosylanthranilate isomerase
VGAYNESNPATTKVKICGLSEPVTMQAALDAGADFVGLVFFAKSPRSVTLEQAQNLADMARGRASIVALTVDATDDDLLRIAESVRPDYIQAHGKEPPDRCTDIKALTRCKVIKAIGVAEAADIAKADPFKTDLILFDAKGEVMNAALPGGNGIAFDWTLLSQKQGQNRGEQRGDFMLAGGLNADNVADAIRITQAPIVDVSSGVEIAPGVKDAKRIAKFIERAKHAF